MTQQVTGIAPDKLDRHWAELEPKLARLLTEAVSDWGYTVQDLYTMIAEGKLQAWTSGESVLLTQLRAYQDGDTEIVLWGVSGKLEPEWENMIEAIIQTSGAKSAVAYCRPGLLPYLRKAGWHLEEITMRKVLHAAAQTPLVH